MDGRSPLLRTPLPQSDTASLISLKDVLHTPVVSDPTATRFRATAPSSYDPVATLIFAQAISTVTTPPSSRALPEVDEAGPTDPAVGVRGQPSPVDGLIVIGSEPNSDMPLTELPMIVVPALAVRPPDSQPKLPTPRESPLDHPPPIVHLLILRSGHRRCIRSMPRWLRHSATMAAATAHVHRAHSRRSGR